MKGAGKKQDSFFTIRCLVSTHDFHCAHWLHLGLPVLSEERW